MGNFYANHAMRSADIDAVASILESHGRRAYVVTVGESTFVYDERCDGQEPDDARALAGILSRECGRPVLAAINHDDDVLWLALADDAGVAHIYDSFPGYFEGGDDRPAVSNLARLCEAFGATGRQSEIEALLRRRHAEVGLEFQRHQELFGLLGLDPRAAILGYGYVANGESSELGSSAQLRGVGGAPEHHSAHDESQPISEASPGPRPEAHMLDMRGALGALALSEIDVPEELAALLGRGRIGGLVALSRFQMYIATHRLVDMASTGAMVRPDALMQRLLGPEPFPLSDAMRKLADGLDVWSGFTAEERDALRRGDPAIQARVAEAAQRAVEQLAKEAGVIRTFGQ